MLSRERVIFRDFFLNYNISAKDVAWCGAIKHRRRGRWIPKIWNAGLLGMGNFRDLKMECFRIISP